MNTTAEGASSNQSGQIGSTFNVKAIIARVKEIILTPDRAWDNIKQENSTITDIYKNYLVLLAALGPIAIWIKFCIIGTTVGIAPFTASYRAPFFSGLLYAVIMTIIGLATTYAAAFAVTKVAPHFNANTTLQDVFKLIAYGSTPVLLAGVFVFIFTLWGFALVIGAIYCIYIMYKGAAKFIQVPEDKKVAFYAVAIVAVFFSSLILNLIGNFLSPDIMPAAFSINGPGGEIDLNSLEDNLKQFQKMMPKP